SSYREPTDFVFANNETGRPRWQESILEKQLKPTAARLGIGKIGWHTFRHTYSTRLRALGVGIKVQQELLRHATIKSTLGVYSQATSEQKRAANTQVVEFLFNKARATGEFREFENPPISNGSQWELVAAQMELGPCWASG